MSLVCVARLTNGRPCSRFRTRPVTANVLCRQTDFIGPMTGTAAQIQEHDEPTRRVNKAAPPSSSPSRSRAWRRRSIDRASPGQGCGQWTVLLLPHARPDSPRKQCESIRAYRIRYSASHPCLSTKSNHFVARPTKKMRATPNAMHRCNTKPPRHRCRGGRFGCRESLSGADRSARRARRRARCSWRTGGSACCRRAAR